LFIDATLINQAIDPNRKRAALCKLMPGRLHGMAWPVKPKRAEAGRFDSPTTAPGCGRSTTLFIFVEYSGPLHTGAAAGFKAQNTQFQDAALSLLGRPSQTGVRFLVTCGTYAVA
jgi:hypothetical protein